MRNLFSSLAILSAIGLFVVVPICRSSADNCAKDMPKLHPTQKLIIEMYYVYRHAGDLESNLCEALKNFPGLVFMKYRMGAFTSKGADGKLHCEPYNCDDDRYVGCQYKEGGPFKSCRVLPILDPVQLANCYKLNQADPIILANGTQRRKLKIPDEKVPALVFDGKYDPCADISSADLIVDYICKLYNYALDGCKK